MESVAARPIEAKKHRWYVFTSAKPLTVIDTKGAKLVLKKGDIFGIQNLNNRLDRVVTPKSADVRYLLPVEKTDDVLDRASRHREPVEFEVAPKKPQKVKKIVVSKPTDPARKKSTAPAVKKPVDRLSLIRNAVKPKVKKPVAKPQRNDFDLDEDTFVEQEPFDF